MSHLHTRTPRLNSSRSIRSLRRRASISRDLSLTHRFEEARMVQNTYRRSEAGVALLLSILALMLLSAIAVTMVYMSSTEKAIGANFKAEETEYFASRAGVEEIRDRMIPGVANYSLNGLVANQGCPGTPASPN